MKIICNFIGSQKPDAMKFPVGSVCTIHYKTARWEGLKTFTNVVSGKVKVWEGIETLMTVFMDDRPSVGYVIVDKE